MRLRSFVSQLTLAVVLSSPALAQGRTIDEGAFVIVRKGAPTQTESFKIAHIDNDLIQATSQLTAGDERISSVLIADSVGTPVHYQFLVKSRGATTLTVRADADRHRMSLLTSDNRSNESAKDFPLVPGKTLILDDWLVHQLYFVALSKRTGGIELIRPRDGHHETGVLTGRGLEPVDVAGRSVTATHYSLVIGSTTREFWVDAGGRLLRVEIPAQGLTATREELPR